MYMYRATEKHKWVRAVKSKPKALRHFKVNPVLKTDETVYKEIIHFGVLSVYTIGFLNLNIHCGHFCFYYLMCFSPLFVNPYWILTNEISPINWCAKFSNFLASYCLGVKESIIDPHILKYPYRISRSSLQDKKYLKVHYFKYFLSG